MTEDLRITALLRHAYGRFDRRLPIGPVTWPFHDLLWIHQGRARIVFEDGTAVDLAAPDGILILPGTPFSGQAIGGAASASVCHFECDGVAWPGHLHPVEAERFDLQALVRLALRLAAEQPQAKARRIRLLGAILDGFAPEGGAADLPPKARRLARAWDQADLTLSRIRSLADVAALIDLRESAFRTLHREVHGTSAGAHLRELRLARAEALLATTGLTLGEIAKRVGYGHAETLNAAFRQSRGMTPGAFRRHAQPFA